MRVLITGGYGFIGSHVVEHYVNSGHQVGILDSITYAARREYLVERGIYQKCKNYHTDLRNAEMTKEVVESFKPELVIHLAAESHVCNSIKGPGLFYETNVMGTFNLLESVRHYNPDIKIVHVSTDEVFGDLGSDSPDMLFNEQSPILPTSPYASSKASSDLLALSYAHTYGMDITVTNCSNNYGKNQHEEKLIPGTIKRILLGENVLIHGEGTQIRDWLHVSDHVSALVAVASRGKSGERYCIGGSCEKTNLEVLQMIVDCLKEVTGRGIKYSVIHTDLRPTDDLRYAISNAKMVSLGWFPMVNFKNGMMDTCTHYLQEHKNESNN